MPTPDMSIWTGRVDHADGPRALRWHQMVKPLARRLAAGNRAHRLRLRRRRAAKRRPGRREDGPITIRRALANLAWHQEQPVYDAGDVRCDDGDMEAAQARLAEAVAHAIKAGHQPLVLGGGHETAWGTFQGIVAAKPDATVGVINIDAHLDLRTDEPGNSGTPFNQMAKWCAANNRPFLYQPVGIAAASNTLALLVKAKELGAGVVHDFDCHTGGQAYGRCDKFAQAADAIYLSIDLDVLPGSVMPAVSSPAAGGVPLDAVESLIGVILDSGLVVAVDMVELNPRFDIDGQGTQRRGPHRLQSRHGVGIVTSNFTRNDPSRRIRAPRGSALTCKNWQTEAALRMLMNNLDPEVAEKPAELVVYGGIGRAARNWECFDKIVRGAHAARR